MNNTLTRREMIRRSLRYGGLAGIGAVGAILAARSRDCRTTGPCAGCPLFQDCALPKAESAKRDRKTSPYPPRDG